MDYLRKDISEHIPALRRYAMSLVRNPTDADDLVQESLCRAIEKMRPWRRIRNRRAYLFTILHNLYIDRIVRSKQRREEVSGDVDQRNMVVSPSQFYRVELQELDEALQKLSADHRDVVLLVGLEGMTYGAAASVLGIPVGTVMSRLSRARESLREMTDRELDAREMSELERGDGRVQSRSGSHI